MLLQYTLCCCPGWQTLLEYPPAVYLLLAPRLADDVLTLHAEYTKLAPSPCSRRASRCPESMHGRAQRQPHHATCISGVNYAVIPQPGTCKPAGMHAMQSRWDSHGMDSSADLKEISTDIILQNIQSTPEHARAQTLNIFFRI